MKSTLVLQPHKHTSRRNNLVDPFGRKLDYLRLSLTERCNLRCTYCMPAEGVPLKPRDHILSFEEMDRLVQIFLDLGIRKIRITGGEPFVRKGAMEFIEKLNRHKQLESMNITTNAVLIGNYLTDLRNLKLESLNISLDSLDRESFKKITLRDNFDIVYENIFKAIDLGIPTKINVVVLSGINDHELLNFAKLAQKHPIEIRFIEAMPFNGGTFTNNITSVDIMDILKKGLTLKEEGRKGSTTSRIFKIPGFRGSIGVIEGFSRTFCASCNRLRVTADGIFKTCLYDRAALDFKELLRSGSTNDDICESIFLAVAKRAKDGFESEARAKAKYNLSMAQIGG